MERDDLLVVLVRDWQGDPKNVRPATDADLASLGYVKTDGIKAAFDAGFEAAPRDWRNSDGYTKKRHDAGWREYERQVLAAIDGEHTDG